MDELKFSVEQVVVEIAGKKFRLTEIEPDPVFKIGMKVAILDCNSLREYKVLFGEIIDIRNNVVQVKFSNENFGWYSMSLVSPIPD